jgi:hypothetical protein
MVTVADAPLPLAAIRADAVRYRARYEAHQGRDAARAAQRSARLADLGPGGAAQ